MLLTLLCSTAASFPPQDVGDRIAATCARSGGVARATVLGESRGGRPIHIVTLAADGPIPETERPAVLIVAGMDLFSDPRGSYPGQSATPNAYAAAHDRDVEARCILATLAAFSGELSIVGDVLKARWAEHQTGAQAPGDPPHH